MNQVTTLRESYSQGQLTAVSLAALSNRSLLLFLIPASMVTLIGNLERIEPHIIEWSIVSLFAYLVPVATILAFRDLVNRTNKYIPISTLGVLLLAGIARGITVYQFGISLPMVPDWDIRVRIVGALTLVVGSFISLGLYESSRQRHVRAIDELQEKQLQVTELRGSLKEQIRQQRDNILEKVSGALGPVLEKVSHDLEQGLKKNVITTLQDSISNVIRPLTQSIAFSDSEKDLITGKLNKVGKNELVNYLPKKVFLGEMFLPGLTLATMASFLITATEIYFPESPVLAGLILLFWVFVGTGLSKSLLSKIEVKTFIAFIYVKLLMVLVAALSFGSLKLFGLYADFLMFYQYILALLVIGFLVFALQIARTQRALYEISTTEMVRELERLNAKLRQEAWLNRNTIATALHGSVQGAFYSSAIKLNNSQEVTSELVQSIDEELSRALEKVYKGSAKEDFAKSFSDLVELWNSVSQISIELPAESRELLQDDSLVAYSAIEVIREGINNAIRHGKAKRIAVKISKPEASTLVIEVLNDGVPLSEKTKAGFGSEILTQLTTNWSLSSGEMTILRAEIAI